MRTTWGLDPRETRLASGRLTDFLFPGVSWTKCGLWRLLKSHLSGVPMCTLMHARKCIRRESEENMSNYDFNDDLSPMLDQSLSAEGLREEYQKKRNHDWILKVEGGSLKEGLKQLTKRQISIIEGFFFDGLCLEDICRTYGMSHEDLDKEIQTMRVRLTMRE